MGYYGNGMALNGSYCIHYGRKGMKWYQNIFADLTSSVANGYRGAANRAGYARQLQGNKAAGANAASSYASKYSGTPAASGASNYGSQVQANLDRNAAKKYAAGGYSNYRGTNFASYGLSSANKGAINGTADPRTGVVGYQANSALVKVGDAIGTTAYNATVVARNIANIAKQGWASAKTVYSKAIARGREILGRLLGLKSRVTGTNKQYSAGSSSSDKNKARSNASSIHTTASGKLSGMSAYDKATMTIRSNEAKKKKSPSKASNHTYKGPSKPSAGEASWKTALKKKYA